MVPRRRRHRRRTGYEILLLPKDGRPARQLGLSKGVIVFFIALLVGNAALIAALFSVSGSQRIELQRKTTKLDALARSGQELLMTTQEQASQLHEFALEAERLTLRLRELEQLSDEVWTLLGENPGDPGPSFDLFAGQGGPDGSSPEDVALRTSLVLGSLSSQVPLHLQELEQLRDLVIARNHRLDHTPSVWPVDGYVSSEFGTRKHPISGNYQRHDGIDIAALRGTAVHAPAAGVVAFAGDRGGYGLTVIIDHGYGVQTLYAHNSKLHVRKGQVVQRGDKISAVGTTGISTGPHLHYEVIVNGEHANPRVFLP